VSYYKLLKNQKKNNNSNNIWSTIEVSSSKEQYRFDQKLVLRIKISVFVVLLYLLNIMKKAENFYF